MPLLVVEAEAPASSLLSRSLPDSAILRRSRSFLQRPAVFISGLTLLALLIQGYHPFVDDAAIYVAGIEKVIHPGLFPVHAEYVLPHLKHSLFSVALGWLVRGLHLPLGYALFLSYVASIWMMIFACWRLSHLLFASPRGRASAMLLMTATLTLPVAGSAIFILDPYLTARSFSTPLTLFAIAYALERRMLAATVCLCGAFILHPLMAAYAIGYVIALGLVRARRWGTLTAAAMGVMLLGIITSHAGALLGGSPAYRVATVSRDYFFLDKWEWFEIFGLFPPLVAAFVYLSRSRFRIRSNYGLIAAVSLYVGALAILFAVSYTRTPNSFLLARLQVLRCFQIIYILFFLLLGSLLGQYVLGRRWWAWAGGFTAIAGLMFAVQLSLYPALKHLEWPWAPSHNPWAQAFLWIRNNTPQDAYFALDPYYQQMPKEDTLGFRAMTERSVLPDWSKDGGIAAIDPALAQQWLNQVTQTKSFSRWDDQQRIETLAPYGVNWIVLPAAMPTQFACPYRNSAVRVCHLPADIAFLSHPSAPTSSNP
ncbi:MAG TPA: hypothetical protein VE195_06460 [Acidobacteriaceae bacterium]|nr:hypothetical protein [Acidobacteriaceae bacterium]